MSYGHLLLRRFATLLALVALFSLNACAGLLGFGGDSWQEEVLLHDGNKLVVDRSVERGGRHEVGQKPAYTKQALAFTHPTTGERVIWEDKATPDLGSSNFLPMALDIYQGTIYLVANPMGCLAYNKWDRPNPPYVVFRYGGKTWEHVPLQELPLETKTPNLISSSPDTEVERLGKYFVDAETIRRITSELRQPENKSILREAVAAGLGISSCEELIHYKCGWGAPGEFNRKYFENICK
ncbi:hypothetical protein [Quatrionicoccus australiensis]|uniref:hypothetical protein n=1 Tax=Quatrionicoccus australiensis TaxID=138118 RepID=UPI001CF847CE|nr:hypothetical protein [Quatrionicoccus australiensis]UCV16641.1 hypothetical protein KI612_08210 [Quatrionicoccus australiensis]